MESCLLWVSADPKSRSSRQLFSDHTFRNSDIPSEILPLTCANCGATKPRDTPSGGKSLTALRQASRERGIRPAWQGRPVLPLRDCLQHPTTPGGENLCVFTSFLFPLTNPARINVRDRSEPGRSDRISVRSHS